MFEMFVLLKHHDEAKTNTCRFATKSENIGHGEMQETIKKNELEDLSGQKGRAEVMFQL
jgi:hypothetical protein